MGEGRGKERKKQEREGGRREGGERKGEGKGEREGREERGRKGVSYCKLEFPTVDTHAELMGIHKNVLMQFPHECIAMYKIIPGFLA